MRHGRISHLRMLHNQKIRRAPPGFIGCQSVSVNDPDLIRGDQTHRLEVEVAPALDESPNERTCIFPLSFRKTDPASERVAKDVEFQRDTFNFSTKRDASTVVGDKTGKEQGEAQLKTASDKCSEIHWTRSKISGLKSLSRAELSGQNP